MTDHKQTRRKLIAFSNYSLCVTLPKPALEDLGWRKGTVIKINVNLPAHQMTLSSEPSVNPIDQTLGKTQTDRLAPSVIIKPYHALSNDEPSVPEQKPDRVTDSLRW